MAPTFVQIALSAFLAAALSVKAETHTISFTNNLRSCGKGTPALIVHGSLVSNGTAYTQSGTMQGIAYLQTGDCLFNGEGCGLLEFNMANPTPGVPGSGSSTDISLITPHELNVPIGFNYYNGCDGQGTQCLTGTCHTAFFQPDDTQVQVACQDDNADLMITFCPDGSSSSGSSSSESAAPASSASATKKAATSSAAAATSTTAAAEATTSEAVETAATSTVKHVAVATSAAESSASASAASSVPTTRASSKTCKAKAAANKRSNQSAAKRANSWHHRSRNARAAF
ncbi:hypothetical protein PENSPDRAFT_306193 [Peniophora sp. CONT]|nr:hypothetical protein PENSPDRAFT_306193 [Peniophora sp. CONT]